MKCFSIKALCFCMLLTAAAFGQTVKKQLVAKRIQSTIKIDGVLDDAGWKDAPLADKFTELRPTPFAPENANNATQVYIVYNNEGIYVGGYLHEKTKDSIASELTGRDGFGNNDFIGVVFDTYHDKLNGFEYFVTPLGEQMDAKVSPNTNGNSEDFSWNAVWESKSKLQADGWTFEMFIPYAAIRFGKKNVQDWGLNIVRRRQKSGQQLFWQPIDPNKNGFLTQEGMITGLEGIKPPFRLQLSPYLSTYINHDENVLIKKTTTAITGGMDIKYGLNQAFTLDMTLIPDFGQVQSDNVTLNLSPFEQQYSENRAFFTEGTELFNKAGLFYSRRIGGEPIHRYDFNINGNEQVIKNPGQTKLYNATKISGRTQKGLGIGLLNAVTRPQYAEIEDLVSGQTRKVETNPLTNYNIIVLDQTLKNNSSVSFINTSTIRSGNDRDADVSAFLFDLNDKKNKWNVGGNFSLSNIFEKGKTSTGYAYNAYFGKTSGKFTFNMWQNLSNNKYDNSDLAYFTNNNDIHTGLWMGYNWNKPGKWYNNVGTNVNFHLLNLVTAIPGIDIRSDKFQQFFANYNLYGQLKNLWQFGLNVNVTSNYNDFYEPRVYGRVFHNKGRVGANVNWNSNQAKKISWGGYLTWREGAVTKRKTIGYGFNGKIRFSSKFSVDGSIETDNSKDQPGWAETLYAANSSQMDTVIFSRRNNQNINTSLNIKYNFTNKMGITLTTRHSWGKVQPLQFYVLSKAGNLETPDFAYNNNRNQNFNYLTTDLVYTWQFAQGSFFNIVWKNISSNFNRSFERNYATNLSKTFTDKDYNSDIQFRSLSVKVIYFLDYLTVKNRKRRR